MTVSPWRRWPVCPLRGGRVKSSLWQPNLEFAYFVILTDQLSGLNDLPRGPIQHGSAALAWAEARGQRSPTARDALDAPEARAVAICARRRRFPFGRRRCDVLSPPRSDRYDALTDAAACCSHHSM